MSQAVTTALENFSDCYNCAQAVASPFFETYGLPLEVGLQVTQGFGSGFRVGEICGAASGGVVIIGLAAQNGEGVSENTELFLERFYALKKAISCKDILGALPEERMLKTEEEKQKDRLICNQLVEHAVRMLEDMGY